MLIANGDFGVFENYVGQPDAFKWLNWDIHNKRSYVDIEILHNGAVEEIYAINSGAIYDATRNTIIGTGAIMQYDQDQHHADAVF